MKKSPSLIIAVSALTLSAGLPSNVFGQVVINCSQNFRVGQHIACSTGTLLINPDGSTMLTGCLESLVAPLVARCTVSTGGAPVTKSVRVDFAKSFVDIKTGVNTVRVDALMMEHTGAASPKDKFTFSPTAISNTVTLDIGGTLNFDDNQVEGNYTGAVSIRANLI